MTDKWQSVAERIQAINDRMLAGDPSMQAGAVFGTNEEQPAHGPRIVTPITIEAIPKFRLNLTQIAADAHEDILKRLR